MEKPWSYVFEEGGKGLAMLTMATLTMATLTMRHAHYGHAHYGHAHYGHAHYTVRNVLYCTYGLHVPASVLYCPRTPSRGSACCDGIAHRTVRSRPAWLDRPTTSKLRKLLRFG